MREALSNLLLNRMPLSLWGALLIFGGFTTFILATALGFVRLVLFLPQSWREVLILVSWYSGIPLVAGVLLFLADLFLLLPMKREKSQRRMYRPLKKERVTVALTAYNDEASIGEAVRDFLEHPQVERVLVVSNNSRDRTIEFARAAGAITINEERGGYGHCVLRCLQEALLYPDAELIVLCEGDMTFRAHDIPKFLAYASHADIVNGTRIVEQLRARSTQLTTFMFYGNFFVAKLLELKHLGRGTLTDMGTTYKLAHRDSLERLLPRLTPRVNLEFNAYLLDMALRSGELVVECPITFHPRVGVSKGGNTNNLRALSVGLRMIIGICVGWRAVFTAPRST